MRPSLSTTYRMGPNPQITVISNQRNFFAEERFWRWAMLTQQSTMAIGCRKIESKTSKSRVMGGLLLQCAAVC